MSNYVQYQPSFWEIDSFFKDLDVLVIGSGLVGLSAAIYLVEHQPHLRVAVLERGPLPIGASTRNAGFACFGSMTELLDDLSTMEPDDVWSLVEQRHKGLQSTRSRLGDAVLDYNPCGGFELFTPEQEALYQECLDHLDVFNKAIQEVTGIKAAFARCDHKIDDFGFRGIQHVLRNRGEGSLHPGKMVKGLMAKAHERDITILTGLAVSEIHEDGNKVVVSTQHGHSYSASRVLVATNGFARQLLPELEVVPARNQVLVTKPIPGLKIKGTFHFDKGYIYFRDIGDRLLIGGARNLDFQGETTTEFGQTDLIQQALRGFVDKHLLLESGHWSVDQIWSGIMGVGKTKKPIVCQVGNRVVAAVRLGGMGVALGSLLGEQSARVLMQC